LLPRVLASEGDSFGAPLIEQLVNKLYRLTDEEIRMVQGETGI
jgi:hypothetical protein